MKLVSSVCALGASFVLLACSVDTHPTLAPDAGVDGGTHHGTGGRSSNGGAAGASSGGSAMGAGGASGSSGSRGSGGSMGRILDGSLPDRLMGVGGAMRMRDGGIADASVPDASMDAGPRGSGGTQGTGGHANGGTTSSGGHAGTGSGGHAGTGTGGHGGQGTGGAPAMCGNILCDCTLNGIKLWGNVRMVDETETPDFVLNIDDNFPDLDVEITDFPDSCGEWNMVDFDEDFTVRIDPNESFPDFTITYSDFPGIPN